MQERHIDPNDWWPNLSQIIEGGAVKTFRTKAQAISTGTKFGWPYALKVVRRFESVWIVGKILFQPDTEGDIPFAVMKIPTLRWVKNTSGVTEQPILTLRSKYK